MLHPTATGRNLNETLRPVLGFKSHLRLDHIKAGMVGVSAAVGFDARLS